MDKEITHRLTDPGLAEILPPNLAAYKACAFLGIFDTQSRKPRKIRIGVLGIDQPNTHIEK
ncbi:hypothetical protein P3339_09535 [Microbulbifer sp. MLAF003]|uniref:hypothetical protein n=1 Tax=unclassified Microbulbifer TaxID=2619833 RepID=UPI0024ACB774|nr:hypothetical protein [Microbulbifer sp. MLAF003]WHI52982.1 hypothetical protein P3339_09535 [Microbulbifer sp. MLAF003]